MNAKNNSPQKKLPFWPGVGLLAIGVPAIFWLRFGRIDSFVISLTGFLLLLIFGVQFIPKLNKKYGAEQESIKVARGRFDWLGIVWFLSIPFAPFLMWLVSSLTVTTLVNWKIILGIKTGICVAVPCVSVLPLLRYVRGRAAPYALLILVIGTGFPVSIGWDSLTDFFQGPKHEQVSIDSVNRIHTSIKYRDIPTEILKVKLTDERMFEANSGVVSIKPGLAEIIFLEHVGDILEVK